ncbi:MAG: tRNA-guanosine(34) transglycosylase [Verrucomicrobia bacterium]|nr:tRNA-guanosine(34) transglycosylase [Verrucomicrobiota bacterium]
MSPFSYEILHVSRRSQARVGRIHTAHGVIDTPGFVAVGTNGTLKGIDNAAVNDIGLQLMFCNTYHLMLQPGIEVVEKAGGLHRFTGRKGPIITDSGGFQVFSLAYGGVANELKSAGQRSSEKLVLKINEEGVLFRSYRDGSKMLLTPETSVNAQKALGADIIIPFDELLPYHTDAQTLQHSFERTHRWEQRSLETHRADPRGQAMYAVIHGGVDHNLRAQSCAILTHLPFEGFAIGGSMGKTRSEMVEMLQATMPHLSGDKPIHLLGIGDLSSLEQCIPMGIDTFDSSYPTRAARHGMILTEGENLKIEQRRYSSDLDPLEQNCLCSTCRHFSRAYLHHLFRAKELTALTLASIHNLHFMVKLMERYRRRILDDEL